MRRSIVAVSATVLAGSAILVAASATAAMSSLETGAKFRWRSSGKKWCNMFLVSDGQPELGSWLDVKQQPWGVGCKVCKETGVSNPFASYSMTKKGQMQNCNLMKHHKSKAHKAAVKEWLKEGGCVGPSPDAAPSLSQFQELMECFGEKRSLTQKELQMAWCLAEGLKALDQKFIAKSSHISLMRDERHGRLAIQFMAVAPDLTTRSGFLGQARQAGTGADNVSLATWAVMKRACSRFYMAPLSQNPGRLKNLFKHLRSRVVALAADAAADEMASCEILRSAHLSLNTEDNQPMLPNLQHVFRDRAHASRRLTSRPWNADEKLKEVMQYMGRGPRSMARLINDSMEIKRIFGEHCRACDSAIETAISCFRSAGHRFESHARPLGRTCLFFHACVKTALHLTKARTDVSAKKAKDWLLWISEEHLLQAAMLADAADTSLALTRSLDTEHVDPAKLKGNLHVYTRQIRSLFVEGRCATVFGFTSTVLTQLKSPIVFNIGNRMKTLGSSTGVKRAIVDTCLGRMQAWVKLAVAAIEAEFPHFEICQAFEIFNLKGLPQEGVNAHLRTISHTYKLDLPRLRAQWEDLYPRAQLEYKEQVGSVKESKDMVHDGNKEAWRVTLARYSSARPCSHPSDVLLVALQNYFCCTPSNSAIEQNFSLGQIRYTMQRRRSLPNNEELVLKLIYGLPKQNKDEKVEICKLARVAWADQYGRPREHFKTGRRADKGIKRKQVDAGLTESSFLRRRRCAAAAAAESYAGTQEQADPLFFTEGHQKEMIFLEKKSRSRRIQATAEKSLPDATLQEQQDAEAASARFAENQKKRREKASRVERHVSNKHRDALLAELSGSKAFLAVSANMELTASLANNGIQVTAQASQANVIVCDKPGESLLPASLQLMIGLRGLVEVSPSFFTVGKGSALKFHRAVSARKVVLVSKICAEKHDAFWRDFRQALPAGHGWKLHKMNAGTVAQLQAKQRTFPKYKAYAVIHEDEADAVSEGDKQIFTTQTFLHRIRRADMVESCSGLMK